MGAPRQAQTDHCMNMSESEQEQVKRSQHLWVKWLLFHRAQVHPASRVHLRYTETLKDWGWGRNLGAHKYYPMWVRWGKGKIGSWRSENHFIRLTNRKGVWTMRKATERAKRRVSFVLVGLGNADDAKVSRLGQPGECWWPQLAWRN